MELFNALMFYHTRRASGGNGRGAGEDPPLGVLSTLGARHLPTPPADER